MHIRILMLAFIAVTWILPAANGWGAHVHRMITYLALEALPAEAPAWLRDVTFGHRAAFQSNQVDRWRGWNSTVLRHENSPEHYLDIEYLDQYGLTLQTVPRLRREYLRAMIIAKHEHPEKMEPYDPARDPARTHEWPGFVLHTAAEHYAKLQAAFFQVRILERLKDPARAHQLEQARAIAIYHLGCLSHFVADMAQPLHTTKHYDGWIGDNPANYKWRDRFHAYIDQGFVDRHELGLTHLRSCVKPTYTVNPADPWEDLIAHLARSHACLEQLYTLERDGRLDSPAGEELILERLGDATSMMTTLIWAAYTSAEPDEEQVASWVRYNGFNPEQLPTSTQRALPPATP
ncbi:MAG: hypothetical protein ABIG44_07440 [Planctomycetota bacterium]